MGSVSKIYLFYQYQLTALVQELAPESFDLCSTLCATHFALLGSCHVLLRLTFFFYINALHSALQCIDCAIACIPALFPCPNSLSPPSALLFLCPGRTAYHSHCITCFSSWRGRGGSNSSKEAAIHSLTQSYPGQTYHNTPFLRRCFSLGVCPSPDGDRHESCQEDFRCGKLQGFASIMSALSGILGQTPKRVTSAVSVKLLYPVKERTCGFNLEASCFKRECFVL